MKLVLNISKTKKRYAFRAVIGGDWGEVEESTSMRDFSSPVDILDTRRNVGFHVYREVR
jgi:hypothetical protein